MSECLNDYCGFRNILKPKEDIGGKALLNTRKDFSGTTSGYSTEQIVIHEFENS